MNLIPDSFHCLSAERTIIVPKYPVHQDFIKYSRFTRYPFSRPLFRLVNPVLNLFRPGPDRLTDVVKHTVPGYGGTAIHGFMISPRDLTGTAPCLVYFHGGGFLIEAAPCHYSIVRRYASLARCRVFFVDYRLTARFSYPTPMEDCFAAYRWLLTHADALQTDAAKVAVGGDSAGGNLAAAVTLMARDRLIRLPRFQLLVYPVVSRRMDTASMCEYSDTPLWNSRLNRKMWDFYLRGTPKTDILPYTSLLDTSSLADLPDAYIETAEFDCLRDEGIQYARALEIAGARVELNQVSGAIHGFDLNRKSDVTQRCILRRAEALLKAFRD